MFAATFLSGYHNMKKILILMLLCGSVNAAQWECIEKAMLCYYWRMPITNGWLVTHGDYGITFVPDQEHEWKL